MFSLDGGAGTIPIPPKFLLCRMSMSISMAISFLLMFLLAINTESAPNYLDYSCSNTTTFAPNSTYQSNLNLLLSSLSSNATSINDDGFHNTTTGEGTDTIYGLFLCRGDVSTNVCQECVTFATRDVIQRCPVEKVAIIWYDECFLRYSNRSFFNTMVDGSWVSLPNTQNARNQTGFNNLVGVTMNDVVTRAVSSVKKFATGERNFSMFDTLYALAQCSLDQSGANCQACLQMAISYLPGCCDGKTGARILMDSCNIRYETYLFYNQSAVAAPPLPPLPLLPPPISGKGKLSCSIYFQVLLHFIFCLSSSDQSNMCLE